MLKSVAVLGFLAVVAVGASAPLAAQARSAVSGTELESAVTSAPASNQATVQNFLEDARVGAVAGTIGVSAADLSAKVATMDEATLNQVAERTRAADLNLAGGDQTIVLGTTAILLIIIIIILLAS